MSRIAQPIAPALACLVGCLIQAQAQPIHPVLLAHGNATQSCPSSSVNDKQTARSNTTVFDLDLLGDLSIKRAELNDISESLKQHEYSGALDEVASQLEKRAVAEWQKHGFLKSKAHAEIKLLSSSPVNSRVTAMLHVEEGQQYRLRDITFKNNKAVVNVNALRNLFSVKGGDIFDVTRIRDGLDKLRYAYANLGYINFTAVPDLSIDTEQRTVSVMIDLDEGKPFVVANVRVLASDDNLSGTRVATTSRRLARIEQFYRKRRSSRDCGDYIRFSPLLRQLTMLGFCVGSSEPLHSIICPAISAKHAPVP